MKYYEHAIAEGTGKLPSPQIIKGQGSLKKKQNLARGRFEKAKPELSLLRLALPTKGILPVVDLGSNHLTHLET